MQNMNKRWIYPLLKKRRYNRVLEERVLLLGSGMGRKREREKREED